MKKINDEQLIHYILHLLPAGDRHAIETALDTDTALQQRLLKWQQVFAQLDEKTTPVTPPERVWQSIASQLAFDTENTLKPAASEASKTSNATNATNAAPAKPNKGGRKNGGFWHYLVPAFATLVVAFMVSFYYHVQPDLRADIMSTDATEVVWQVAANDSNITFVSVKDISVDGMDCVAWIQRKTGEKVRLGQVPDTGSNAKKRLPVPPSLALTAGDSVVIYMVDSRTQAALENMPPNMATLEPI